MTIAYWRFICEQVSVEALKKRNNPIGSGMTSSQCPHCKMIGTSDHIKQFHGENCQYKQAWEAFREAQRLKGKDVTP